MEALRIGDRFTPLPEDRRVPNIEPFFYPFPLLQLVTSRRVRIFPSLSCALSLSLFSRFTPLWLSCHPFFQYARQAGYIKIVSAWKKRGNSEMLKRGKGEEFTRLCEGWNRRLLTLVTHQEYHFSFLMPTHIQFTKQSEQNRHFLLSLALHIRAFGTKISLRWRVRYFINGSALRAMLLDTPPFS